jgi:hypothetical protein
MKTYQKLLITCLSLFQFGCGSSIKSQNGIFEATSLIWSPETFARDKQDAINKAIKECSGQNRITNVIDQGRGGDKNWYWVVRFSCITLADVRQLEQAERDKRQREIDLQNRMKAEAEERERKRQAAIAEEERRKAEEWERGRPQREAEARRAMEAEKKRKEAERKRLDGICPIYWVARQSCATSPDVKRCMEIRIGKAYSTSDDSVCFNR